MRERRVLLVDEDDNILRLIGATLALKDIESIPAENAEQALSALRTYEANLVISSLELPEMHGFDLVRRGRDLPGNIGLPFLFMAKDAAPHIVQQGRDMGAVGFLARPFAVDELLVRVLTIFGDTDTGVGARTRQISGNVEVMALPDLLRQLGVQEASGTLLVRFRGVAADGILYLRDGLVVAAEFALLTGVDALFAMLPHERGSFRFEDRPPSVPTEIGEETLPLLMEAYRLLDEGLLRRIDPREPSAVAAFSQLLDSHRQATPMAGAAAVSLPTGRTGISEALAEEVELEEVDLDEVGMSTEDFAPAFLTSELDAIEAELVDGPGETLGRDDRMSATGTPLVIGEPDTSEARALDEELPYPANLPRPEEPEEMGVALVADTLADMEIAAALGAPSRTPDVVGFFETILEACRERIGAHAAQIGSRRGRIIISNIPEVTRRDTVAAFSREAIQFANEDRYGNRYASLDAGDLHVLVVEVDHLRLLTLLFPEQPEPELVLAQLGPLLEEYRRPR